jgi:hypothetical protein
MLTKLRNTIYIHDFKDLEMAFNELFKALPDTHGLRIQVRALDYTKDSHTKLILEGDIKGAEEEMGSEVPKVSSEYPKGEKEAADLHGGSSS